MKSPQNGGETIMGEEDMDVDDLSERSTSVTIAKDLPSVDLDSQPLTDLGVDVLDQDVLERTVAAQVILLLWLY